MSTTLASDTTEQATGSEKKPQLVEHVKGKLFALLQPHFPDLQKDNINITSAAAGKASDNTLRERAKRNYRPSDALVNITVDAPEIGWAVINTIQDAMPRTIHTAIAPSNGGANKMTFSGSVATLAGTVDSQYFEQQVRAQALLRPSLTR